MNIVHFQVITDPRVYDLNVKVERELKNQWKPFRGLVFDEKTKCFVQVVIKREQHELTQ